VAGYVRLSASASVHTPPASSFRGERWPLSSADGIAGGWSALTTVAVGLRRHKFCALFVEDRRLA
jgi:hypothetical protein